MYQRFLEQQVIDSFFSGKATLVIGARQVGKTTLCKKIIAEFQSQGKRVVELNADNPTDREILNNQDFSFLNSIVGAHDIIFIDEAQKVSTIGQTLKLLVDNYKNKKHILATGSSSFNLLNLSSEPLTGRKIVFHLYPLSLAELFTGDPLEARKSLPNVLVYGSYPNVIAMESQVKKRDALLELSDSTMYKDIFEFQLLRNPSVLRDLVKALALQVGSEVSYTELSSLVGIDQKTVERYIDLLEKNFVLFRLLPHHTNRRKEISKSKKIFFYDVGIRNAAINNFSALDVRTDPGSLWENLMLVERMKHNAYRGSVPDYRFWRTFSQAEVDMLELREDAIEAYEFKWSERRTPRISASFTNVYPQALSSTITPENFTPFVGIE